MPEKLSVVVVLTGLCALTFCAPREYHFIDSPQSWSQAQSHCRQHYTDLATVRNIEEMNLLVNTALQTSGGFREKAWIGLYDNLTSWQWSYERGLYDQPISYTNWALGEPDVFLGNEMCVKMGLEGQWEDAQCRLNYSFICYDGFNDAGFIFVKQARTWSGAQQYCWNFHTDLATVMSAEENQFVQSLAGNRSAWIGLFRERQWSDQSVATYRYWMPGQPDNTAGSEFCTATDLGNAGLWSDERCDFPRPFICYSDTDEVTEKYVVKMLVSLVSTEPLTEDELQYMVSVQYRDRLIQLGLPGDIKVAMKSPVSLDPQGPVRGDES